MFASYTLWKGCFFHNYNQIWINFNNKLGHILIDQCAFAPDDLKSSYKHSTLNAPWELRKRAVGCFGESEGWGSGGKQTRCTASESYRHCQSKLQCSGLARLQSTVTKVENKNISGKLTAYFHRPDGHKNTGRLYKFPPIQSKSDSAGSRWHESGHAARQQR